MRSARRRRQRARRPAVRRSQGRQDGGSRAAPAGFVVLRRRRSRRGCAGRGQLRHLQSGPAAADAVELCGATADLSDDDFHRLCTRRSRRSREVDVHRKASSVAVSKTKTIARHATRKSLSRLAPGLAPASSKAPGLAPASASRTRGLPSADDREPADVDVPEVEVEAEPDVVVANAVALDSNGGSGDGVADKLGPPAAATHIQSVARGRETRKRASDALGLGA